MILKNTASENIAGKGKNDDDQHSLLSNVFYSFKNIFLPYFFWLDFFFQ